MRRHLVSSKQENFFIINYAYYFGFSWETDWNPKGNIHPPQGEELFFVNAAKPKLVADLGDLAIGELHLDELGTGKGLAIRALQ
jgi:hypothetical protein